MPEKSQMQKFIDLLVLIAKIASFLSLVMSVAIKARVLLGLSNDLDKKKKAFEEKKKQAPSGKKG